MMHVASYARPHWNLDSETAANVADALTLSELETVDLYAAVSSVVELPDAPPRQARFLAKREELLEKLNRANKASPTRTPKDILKNVCLSINGAVDFRVTDAEIELTQSCEFERNGDLESTVPIAQLLRIVRKVGKGETIGIRLESSGTDWREELNGFLESNAKLHAQTAKLYYEPIDPAADDSLWKLRSADSIERALKQPREDIECTLTAGNAKFTLKTTDPAEFPPANEFRTAEWHSVAAPEFVRLVEQTEYATDVDSNRYALGGVSLETDDHTLRLIATDSRRLAWAECAAESNPGNLDQFDDAGEYAERIADAWKQQPPVIPVKAVKVACSLADAAPDGSVVSIGVDINNVQIRCQSGDGESWRVTSRLVGGRFPRWRDVVPDADQFGHVERFEREALCSAIEQALVCTDGESRGGDFEFPESHVCHIKMTSAENGNADVSVATRTAILGERCPSITIDPRYVLDFAKRQPKGAEIYLGMIDCEKSARMFATSDGAELKQETIIMPLSRER